MNRTQETEETYPRRDQFEDEVELIDYLRTMWKWKWLIIGGTLLCMLAAAIYGFTRPVVKMYEVSALIEIDPKAKLDPLDKIKSMIEYGVFNQQVLKELSDLKGISEPGSLSFDVTIPKGLNILDIAYKTPSPDLGRAVLNTLIREIKKEYKEMIDKAKYQLDEKIGGISESIKDNQTDIKIIKINNNNRIDALRTRIKDVQASIPLIRKRYENDIALKEEAIKKHRSNIESLKENIGTIRSTIEQIKKVFQTAQLSSEKLTAQRDAIVLDSQNNKGQGDTFLHAAAIQQIINYPIELRNKINSLSFQEKKFFKEIFSENESIKDLEAQIQVLRMEKKIALQKEQNTIKDLVSQIQITELRANQGIAAEINTIAVLESEIEISRSDRDKITGVIVKRPPTASLLPIKYKAKRNAILAGAVGFFLLIFLAFFIEYIKNASQRTQKAV